MTTLAVRVWLPDRPGALGLVASRIGAVRGEIVGIDILERGAGRVIDEIFVDLAGPDLVDLLVSEINHVDGVDVEDVRLAPDAVVDPGSAALELAADLVNASDEAAVIDLLIAESRRLLRGSWSALVAVEAGTVVASGGGDRPETSWLVAFAGGVIHAPRSAEGPDDVLWAVLSSSGFVFVTGRTGIMFHAREHRQVEAIARIADSRLVALRR